MLWDALHHRSVTQAGLAAGARAVDASPQASDEF